MEYVNVRSRRVSMVAMVDTYHGYYQHWYKYDSVFQTQTQG